MTRRLPRRHPYYVIGAGVVVVSPAPGSIFYVDTATNVTLNGPDATYETSWVSDFSTTNGDITVVAGTGTAGVTAAWDDGIATVERTILYVRNKAIGGPAATQLVTQIVTSPHSAVQDGTIALAYDLNRPSTVTQAAGVCTAWAPIEGGTAADVLITLNNPPTYTASDSLFGGRPSVLGDTSACHALQSTTPASAVAHGSPSQFVAFCVAPSATLDALLYTADADTRAILRYSSVWRLFAGTSVDSTAATDSAVASMLTAHFDAATNSVLRARDRDGDLAATPLLDIGTGTGRGFTLFANSTGGVRFGDSRLTALLAVTDLSPADIYRLEQWYQLSAVRGGCAASGWTAQLDAAAYLGVAGYWPTDPTDGVVTLDQATVNDPSVWTESRVTRTTGQSDPLGGSSATQFVTAGGLGSSAHYGIGAIAAGVNSYYDATIWLKPIAPLNWVMVYIAGRIIGYANLNTGATSGVDPADTLERIAGSDGQWQQWRAKLRRALGTSATLYVYTANDAPNYVYDAGAGGDGFVAYAPVVTQTRVAGIADQSGLAADFTQATDANQRLFWDETVNGIVVTHREAGRISYELCDNTTLTSVFKGDDPAFAIMGLVKLSNTGGAAPMWAYYTGSGAVTDRPVQVLSDTAKSYRTDDVPTVSDVQFGTASHTVLTTSFVAFAVIVNADRTRELWISGVLVGTAAMADLAANTLINRIVNSPYAGTTHDILWASLAVFAGQVPGADTYARMAYLEAALQHEADKYGLTAGLLVHFTTAAGTVFANLPSTAIAITAVTDGDYEFSFDSSFATIRGTVTVTSGVGTGTIAPLPADNGSTYLYVRDVGGSGALNSLACSVLAVTGYWPTDPTDGLVSVTTTPNLPEDVSTWSTSNIPSVTIGGADPLGGSNAYRVYESTDGSDTSHGIYTPASGAVPAYADIYLWIKPVGRDFGMFKWGSSNGNYIHVNFATGTSGTSSSGHSATVVDTAAGGWKLWKLTVRQPVNINQFWIRPSDILESGTFCAYTGDGREAFQVYRPTSNFVQIRVSDIADQSGLGADLAQATAANQPLFWETTENGLVVPHREAGRNSNLSTTDATVLAVASGDDPAFAIIGVFAAPLGADFDGPLMFKGAGSIVDIPLQVYSSNVRAVRNDGTTNSSQAYTADETLVGSLVPYAVICNTDRTRELWLPSGGTMTLINTVTMADLASATMTALYWTRDDSTTPDVEGASLAFYAGQVPGADATARYAFLQPALSIMAAKYGLTA